MEDWKRLSKTDAEFQEALTHASDSYRDPRVRAAFAMAPALGPAFLEVSLDKISIPVEIVSGSADENAPVESSAKYFVDHIPGAKLTLFPDVGHYVFLPTCTELGRESMALLCTDAEDVDRAAIHAKTTKMALRFFDANLKR